MKPPICCICDNKLLDMDDGGLIYFKKRPSNLQWDERMGKKGMVGHPPYAKWFCKEHYEKANDFKHLPVDEAMKILKY